MGIQDIVLPFTKKSDLERKKAEMRQAIGLFGGKTREERLAESEHLEKLAAQIKSIEAEFAKNNNSRTCAEEINLSKINTERSDSKKITKETKETPFVEVPKKAPKQKEEASSAITGTVEPLETVNKAYEDPFKKTLPVFYFWYCDLKASNIGEFEKAIQNAPINSIEHHASNHDFSKWLSGNMPEYFIKPLTIAEDKRGEELRKAILDLICELRKNLENTKYMEPTFVEAKNDNKKTLKEPIFTTF